MKKYILSLMISAICAGNVLAQEEEKPSKEATVAWLKEKLEKYIFLAHADNAYRNLKLDNIDECSFTISYDSYQCRYYKCGICKECTEVAYNYHATVTYMIDENLYYETWSNQIYHGFYSTVSNVTFSNAFETLKNKGGIPQHGVLAIKEEESDIINRVMSAFRHLSSFCPKKKETF